MTITLMFILSVLPSLVSATDWYVDNQAAGSNNGTSWTNAWQSFGDISWALIQPGDIVYISGGTESKTYTETLDVNADGTPGNHITIMNGQDAYHNGQVILDGEMGLTYGVTVENNDYVTVKGLNVRNYTGSMIRVRYSTDPIIEDNEIYITSHGGVYLRGNTNAIVRNNRMTTPSYIVAQTDGIYSGLNNGNIYENNHIVISNEQVDEHCDGIQLYQDRDITIRNNYIEQDNSKESNAQGIYITESNGIMETYGNVVYGPNTKNGLLTLRNIDTGVADAALMAYHNTLVGGGWGTLLLDHSPNSVTKNNLLVCYKDNLYVYRIYTGTSPVAESIDYNLYYVPNSPYVASYESSPKTWSEWTNYGYETNGINALDPLFVDVASRNFRLQSDSPAIDNGIGLTSKYDKDPDGSIRGQDGLWDIGAYEYQSTSCESTNILCVDDDPGPQQEYTTIQAAVDAAIPGDTILIFDGYYNGATIAKSGTPGNYITIKGADGNFPTVYCSGRSQAFRIGYYSDIPSEMHGQDYLWFENMEITNCPSDGIRTVWVNGSGSNHIVLKNLEIHDVFWNGIYLAGGGGNWLVENLTVYDVGGHCLKFAEYDMNGVVVINNTLYNCGEYPENTDYGRHPYGIQVSYMDFYDSADVSNFLIKDNTIYNTWQAAINFNIAWNNITIADNNISNSWTNYSGNTGTGMGAIQIGPRPGNLYNITIKGNRIYNSSRRGISISGDTAGSQVRIFGNLIYGSKWDGLYDSTRDGVIRNVTHNTFYNNGQGDENYTIYSPYRNDPGFELANNILYHIDENECMYWNRDALYDDIFDYNLYWKPGAVPSTDVVYFFQLSYMDPWTLSEFQAHEREANGILADPLFVDADSGDFRLQGTSPACGTGQYGTNIGAFGCIGQTYHRSDINHDGCIETGEMVAFMDRWKISSQDVTMPELMESIGLWKAGTGCF